MKYPVPSRANELLAMNKLRLRAAVGLLTGHTSLRAHLYKLGHTERQECWLCGYDKEDSVHIVCDCPVLACKRYRIFGCIFLKPEDLENVRVISLLSLVANTGLGLVSTSWTGEEIQWNSNDLGVARVFQGTPRFYLLLLLK
jgi:hypothetical protein